MQYRYQVLQKKVLFYYLFSFLLSLSVHAQEPQRFICKDSHEDYYFSFVPPQGWQAVNVDDIRGRGRNKVFQLSSRLNTSPQGGTVTTVCHPVGKSNYQQPLIFISRVYNMNGTGTELEEKWRTEKYQKKKKNEIYSKDALFSNNSYSTGRFPSISLDDIEIINARYDYRQDIHTAVESIEGTVQGTQFVRIRATILGGLSHAEVFCHLEDPNHQEANDLVEQIVTTFEFESDNVFGGPLDQQNRGWAAAQRRRGLISMLIIFSPSMFLGTLGIWLSARYYDLPCKFYIALLVSVVATMAAVAGLYFSFRMPFSFLILYAVTSYGLLVLIIQEDYEELMKVTGFGLLGALIPFVVIYIIWAYIWIGAASVS